MDALGVGWRPGGFAAIVKAVREYRTRYPDKAVTYYADMNCPSGRDGWAVLIGGGSLASVRIPVELAKTISSLRPSDGVVSGDGKWCLPAAGGDYLVDRDQVGESLVVDLPMKSARYHVHWIDAKTGADTEGDEIAVDQPLRLKAETNVLWLERTSSD